MLEALPSFHHQGLFWLDPIMIGRHSSKQILAFWLLDNSLLEDFQGSVKAWTVDHALSVLVPSFEENPISQAPTIISFGLATLLFIPLINGVWLGKGMGVLDCGVGCVI
ncbi:hypothetical protein AAG906_013406 [Vitis piasezkii]